MTADEMIEEISKQWLANLVVSYERCLATLASFVISLHEHFRLPSPRVDARQVTQSKYLMTLGTWFKRVRRRVLRFMRDAIEK